MLLRKRLDPEIVTWANNAKDMASKLSKNQSDMGGQEWDELWDWAAPESNDIIRGIFPELAAEDDDEEPAQPPRRQNLTAAQPSASLDDTMTFAATGMPPRNVR
jgi:hypothetical protein